MLLNTNIEVINHKNGSCPGQKDKKQSVITLKGNAGWYKERCYNL